MENVKYEEVIEIGPRKISRISKFPLIYLPQEFLPLYGKRVMVVLKVLPERRGLKVEGG
ncbi:MAG: hypothetical protein QXX69_03620 [Sulfolobales archaeon]